MEFEYKVEAEELYMLYGAVMLKCSCHTILLINYIEVFLGGWSLRYT
jgi:hypothetical protein